MPRGKTLAPLTTPLCYTSCSRIKLLYLQQHAVFERKIKFGETQNAIFRKKSRFWEKDLDFSPFWLVTYCILFCGPQRWWLTWTEKMDGLYGLTHKIFVKVGFRQAKCFVLVFLSNNYIAITSTSFFKKFQN